MTLLTNENVKPLCDALFSPYDACRYSPDADTIFVLDEHSTFRQVLHILVSHPKKYNLIYYGTDSEFTPYYLECVRAHVKHIWAQNCRIVDEALITKLPIGFPNGAKLPPPHQIVTEKKDTLCYLPKLGLYDEKNLYQLAARVFRQECLKYLENHKKFVEIESQEGSGLPIDKFYEKLSRCKFVVCPMGVGLDTYRVFEACYMGAIPIVLRSSGLGDIYEKFGALVVDSWEDITEPLLENHAPYSRPPQEMFELEYWLNKK